MLVRRCDQPPLAHIHTRTACHLSLPVSSLFCVVWGQYPCPSGFYGEAPGLVAANCTGPCSLGYECPAGSTSPTTGLCPLGYYCAGGPKRPCPPGRYSSVTGTVSLDACVPCGAGTFSATVAATGPGTCTACAAHEGSTPGAIVCWPGLVSAVASNPPPLVVGLSVGDVVTLTFSSPTDTPDPTSCGCITFSPPLGAVPASWRAGGTQLQVRVVDVAGVDPASVDVARAALSVVVRGVRSASGDSLPSPPVSVVVGGTWGAPGPPGIVHAVAVDGGGRVGPGSGDAVVLVFDQPVWQVPVGDAGQVLALLRFSPPWPAWVVLNGTWLNASALHVGLLLAVPAAVTPGQQQQQSSVVAFGSDWLPWNVGRLSVSVLPGGGLRSANGESAVSNSSAMVDAGSWGDASTLTLSEKNATSVQVVMSPPSTSVGYDVHTCVLQWGVVEGGGGVADIGDGGSWQSPLPTSVAATLAAVRPDDRATSSTQSDAPYSVVDVGVASLAVATVTPFNASVGFRGSLLVELGLDAIRRRYPVALELTGLVTGSTYRVRGVCNGPDDTMGPPFEGYPSSVTPQPPLLTRVTIAGTVLSTAGGAVVTLVGNQVGGQGARVTMVLSNGRCVPSIAICNARVQ